jgi:Na+/H+ antiporter NhaD/arsenite permease-like protein
MVKLLHHSYVETVSIVCATFNIHDISGIGFIPIFRHLSLSWFLIVFIFYFLIYKVYTRKHCDSEKKNLEILLYLHIFSNLK